MDKGFHNTARQGKGGAGGLRYSWSTGACTAEVHGGTAACLGDFRLCASPWWLRPLSVRLRVRPSVSLSDC
jgi:hypothetical protein